jgi:uncharacterized repeat protein (TIGR03803 family)
MKFGWVAGASFGLLAAIAGLPAQAATEQVLFSLPSNAAPYGRLETDATGALYGTAVYLDGYGAAFRLKQHSGAWQYKKILDFGGKRGAYPAAGLVEDRLTGIFYGTTQEAGRSGGGTVYALVPAGRGWNRTVLHSFGGADGTDPVGSLLRDKATGNLYGTTYAGGAHGCGTAFQLVQSNGSWTFRTIYAFRGGSDGCHPYTQLRSRTKTGTLIGGTIDGNGTIFQLKEKRGVWRESVIYSFTGGSDGWHPFDLDGSGDGTIYGVAVGGGVYGLGAVFQLTPYHKTWKYTVIYSFGGGGDGIEPSGINFDASAGVLYGTTDRGGKWDMGTVFQLSNNGGIWKETVLHSFRGGSDGADPVSRPIVDGTTGTLYGTTIAGGAANGGTVYAVQP